MGLQFPSSYGSWSLKGKDGSERGSEIFLLRARVIILIATVSITELRLRSAPGYAFFLVSYISECCHLPTLCTLPS